MPTRRRPGGFPFIVIARSGATKQSRSAERCLPGIASRRLSSGRLKAGLGGSQLFGHDGCQVDRVVPSIEADGDSIPAFLLLL